MAKSNNKISLDNDNLQAIFVCAIRYSLGRRTYMPHLVIDFLISLLPHLSDKTLSVIERDIREAEKMGIGYGDDLIDKPKWLLFHGKVVQEIDKRKTKAQSGG